METNIISIFGGNIEDALLLISLFWLVVHDLLGYMEHGQEQLWMKTTSCFHPIVDTFLARGISSSSTLLVQFTYESKLMQDPHTPTLSYWVEAAFDALYAPFIFWVERNETSSCLLLKWIGKIDMCVFCERLVFRSFCWAVLVYKHVKFSVPACNAHITF